MSFVKQKLHDAGVDVDFTSHQVAYIERLGGRASDLEVVSIGTILPTIFVDIAPS